MPVSRRHVWLKQKLLRAPSIYVDCVQCIYLFIYLYMYVIYTMKLGREKGFKLESCRDTFRLCLPRRYFGVLWALGSETDPFHPCLRINAWQLATSMHGN